MDWKLWAFLFGVLCALISAIGVVINYLATQKSHKKIVYNDLHHLAIDVTKNAGNIDNLTKTVGEISENVSYIKGKIDNRRNKK